MSCDEFEIWILESQDDPSAPTRPPALDAHLADCDHCRTFVRQIEQLDAMLARSLNAPRLPLDFQQRLRQRIQAGSEALPEARLAERKGQLQGEFEAGLKTLGWRCLPSGNWMAVAGCAMGAALACWMAWQFLPPLAALLGPLGVNSVNQNITQSIIAGALYLVIGLACAAGHYKLWTGLNPSRGH
jgi:anti-sigma factor RsiW